MKLQHLASSSSLHYIFQLVYQQPLHGKGLNSSKIFLLPVTIERKINSQLSLQNKFQQKRKEWLLTEIIFYRSILLTDKLRIKFG
jgi:hypothetical protein